MKRKIWFGPAYMLEGFLFATGCFTRNFVLTTGAVIGGVATTIADLHNRHKDIRDAKNMAFAD